MRLPLFLSKDWHSGGTERAPGRLEKDIGRAGLRERRKTQATLHWSPPPTYRRSHSKQVVYM